MSRRCPSPIELERGYWSGEAAIAEHARACTRCAGEWAAIELVVAATRDVAPIAVDAERREELRATILSRVEVPAAAAERSPWRWLFAAPLAAAAAVLLMMWWPTTSGEPRGRAGRAEILAHDDARFLVASARPDEIVRLVEGAVSVRVTALGEGERFRVIAGNGELETRGATAFDVRVERDRLVAVRTMHGTVEVRAAGAGEPIVVAAGETWNAAPVQVAVAPPNPNPIPTPMPMPTPTSIPTPTSTPTPARTRAPAVAARATPAEPDEPAPAEPAPAEPAPTDATPAIRTATQQAYDDGWRALRGDDFAAAAMAFERAATDATLAEDASFWRAVALGRRGDAPAAITAFERFLTTHPRAVRAGEASAMLGWLLHDRGDHEAAARRFRDAARDPSARVRDSAVLGLQAVGAAKAP